MKNSRPLLIALAIAACVTPSLAEDVSQPGHDTPVRPRAGSRRDSAGPGDTAARPAIRVTDSKIPRGGRPDIVWTAILRDQMEKCFIMPGIGEDGVAFEPPQAAVQVAQAAGGAADPSAAQPEAAASAAATQPEAAANSPATQPAAAEPAPEGAIPVAAVRTLDAEYASPKLIGLTLTGLKGNEPGELSLFAGHKIFVPADQVLRVQVQPTDGDRASLPRMPDNAVALVLCNGEWLGGLISGGDERQVQITVVGLGEISVPLRRVRGVVTPAGRAGVGMGQIARGLLTESPAPADGEKGAVSDTLKLANGEAVHGTVVSITATGLTVQGELGNLTVGLDVLTVAQLANALEPPAAAGPRSVPPAAWVEMTNGSRLLAAKLDWAGRAVRITRPGSPAPLELSDSAVAAIEVITGRWRWLDQLTPALSEHRPFLTVHWPARFGVNAVGGPIRLGERNYTHGIGVHSASRLVFDTQGAKRFHCLAGLDAAAGPLGNVGLRVLVDGQVKFERKSVKAGDEPIPIDLTGLDKAQKLELRVDFGANGDVQDRFDWADAALVW